MDWEERGGKGKGRSPEGLKGPFRMGPQEPKTIPPAYKTLRQESKRPHPRKKLHPRAEKSKHGVVAPASITEGKTRS